MPFSDLREFVNKLDEAGELARVRKGSGSQVRGRRHLQNHP